MPFKRGKHLLFWLLPLFVLFYFIISNYIVAKQEKITNDSRTIVVLPKNKTSAKTGLNDGKKLVDSLVEKSHFGNFVLETKTINNSVFDYRDTESGVQVPWKYDKRFKNPCWYERDELKCLPYFFIVGVHKCGTTSLHSSIVKHPECVFFGRKESQFFGWETRKKGKGATDDIYKYIDMFAEGSRKIQKYQEIKNDTKGLNPLIMGDSSPDFLYVNTNWREMPGNEGVDEPRYVILDYIHHLLPEAKVLATFRDPVDRMYSEYLFIHRKEAEQFNATEATPEKFHKLVDETIALFKMCLSGHSMRSCVYYPEMFQRVYLPSGIYYVYYEELLRVFPRNQIHLVQMEELGLEKTVQEVYDFLELGPASEEVFTRILMTGVQNQRNEILQDVGPMLKKTRKLLYQFYRPYNEKMADLTGDSRFLYPYHIDN